ncbi:MAG: hypothetical protein QOD47_1346 [Gemmatimonadaceae bacterium]|jgi:hypothetical protein|nr:hypothetical protein [Gemmatimonadaceae bacterium]
MIFVLICALTGATWSSTGVRVSDAHTRVDQVPQACLTRAASPGM